MMNKQRLVFCSFMEIHKIIQQHNYNNVLKSLKHVGYPTLTVSTGNPVLNTKFLILF